MSNIDTIETHAPKEFGGMGGVVGGRPRDPDDLFEAALDRACGEKMRSDCVPGAHHAGKTAASQVWGALANTKWSHVNGDAAWYSFRAAGDMIAAIVGNGTDYMDYYCSAMYPNVPEWIAKAMETEGWSHSHDDTEICSSCKKAR